MNESNLNRMIREHKARIIWFLVFLILAVFVTALVFGTLKRSVQAQTYTKRVFACPYAQEGAEPVAHQHNDDCYENGELICTLPERELHIHGDECYAEEKVLVCTLEESEGHAHTDSCYTEEPILVCGLEENNGHVHSVENGCYTRVQGDLICTDEDPEHVHTDECYAWEEVLTCEIPEGEGAHHHSEECYETQLVLSCGKEEGEGAHTHDDTCYEINKVLICDKEEVKTEHVHTVDCFQVTDMSPEEIHALHMSELPESDPDADVESPDVWESRFASVPLSGHWDRDLLKIAETQLGYTESQRNFEAVPDEYGDGYTLKGWTRYGAWYGIPYGDWCAMFISFCLNYADIPESAIPYDCATTTWIDSLSARGMYAPAGSYDPKPGDLIFFDWEGDGLSDHVGIVWAVNPGSITTIEGNHTISVELFDYDLSDGHIQGYGILPENPALAVTESEENESGDKENPDEAEGGAASAAGASDNADPSNNNNNVDTENTEKTEPDPETLAKMPPFSYSERVAGMRVSIEADEGAFPEGTTVTIKPIEDDGLAEKVAPAVSGQVVKVQAVDITFYDADGNEIEPRIPIRVTMRPFNDTAEADNVEVVHMANDGTVTAVTPDESIAQPDKGAAFDANSFSPYMLVYTVNFAFDKDGNVLEYSFAGGTSVSLRTLLVETGIKSEEEVDDYLSQIVSVVFSKPECLEVTKQGNDWLLKSVHAFDTDEKLTVTLNNGIAFAVPVAVTGIEELQLENASISTVDGVFLPENTEGYANVVEDASAAINAVENHIGGAEGGSDPSTAPAQQVNSDNNGTPEKNTVAEETIVGEDIPVASAGSTLPDDESGSSDVPGEKPVSDVAYQVFDIGLEIENMDDLGQAFNVSVNLPQEVAGTDFRLYHIHDDTVEEIPVKLFASNTAGGSQLVSGFEFVTDSFSEFVLRYTVDFEYIGDDGKIHSWSFPGCGVYSLQSILQQIGIENAVIMDATLDLLEGQYIEGALYLTEDKTSLKSDIPFTDKYKLTIITDLQRFVFQVTDAAANYRVVLQFNTKSPEINDEDNLYLVIKVENHSSGTLYYVKQITVTEGNSELIIDTGDGKGNWYKDSDRNNSIEAPSITGNENFSIHIYNSKDQNPSSAQIIQADQNSFRSLNEGDYFKANTISFNKDREVKTENSYTTVSDYVLFNNINVSNDWNYLSILGNGVNYGITADHYTQKGHIQSNFAVNHYTWDGEKQIEPDLAGNGAVLVAADYDLITKDGKPYAIEIGGSHVPNTETVIYLGKYGSNDPRTGERSLVYNVNGRDWVHVYPTDPEDLRSGIVEPIIQHGDAVSSELLKHSVTFSPASNKIDLLDFPEDATIYLDGDQLEKWLSKSQDDGFYITKHKNQMIVFNFDTLKDVTLGQYHVRYAKDEDDKYTVGKDWFNTYSPTGRGHEDNIFVDELAQHIVYNLSSANKISIKQAVGIILAPNEDSEISIDATSAGWIISDGHVQNEGHEWHSVYSKMPDSTTINLTAYKTVDNKIPTAVQKFNFELEQFKDKKWVKISDPIENDNGSIVFNGIPFNPDGRWNLYRITETAIAASTSGSYLIDTNNIYAVVECEIIGDPSAAQPVIIAKAPAYFKEDDEGGTLFFDEEYWNKDAGSLIEALNGSAGTGIRLSPKPKPAFENLTTTNNGTVKVTKTFSGIPSSDEIPQNFKIIASWPIEGDNPPQNNIVLTTTGEPATLTGEPATLPDNVTVNRTVGSDNLTYVWTISHLPTETKVRFTEEGYGIDGYTVTVKVNDVDVTLEGTTNPTTEVITEESVIETSFKNQYIKNPELVITIKKYDDSEPRKQIGGAVFELWRGDEIVTHDKYDWLDSNNQFTVTDDPDGYTIRGLEDGTYQIKEVHHPDGYVITNEIPVTFTVDKGAIVASTVKCKGGATYEYEQVPNPIFSIVNHAGTELPKTGGTGMALYGLLGGLMVVTAGAVLTLRKKKNKA